MLTCSIRRQSIVSIWTLLGNSSPPARAGYVTVVTRMVLGNQLSIDWREFNMINLKIFDMKNFTEMAEMYHDYIRISNGLETVSEEEYDEILSLLTSDVTKKYTYSKLQGLLEGTEYVFLLYAAEIDHDYRRDRYGREMLIEDGVFEYFNESIDISKCRTISFYSQKPEYLERNRKLNRFVFCCHKLWDSHKLSLRAYIYKKPSALARL